MPSTIDPLEWSESVFAAIDESNERDLTTLLECLPDRAVDHLRERNPSLLISALKKPDGIRMATRLTLKLPGIGSFNDPLPDGVLPRQYLLLQLIESRHDDLVLGALSRGVKIEVNVVDKTGDSALHLAADRLSPSIIDALVRRGADATRTDHNDETALARALRQEPRGTAGQYRAVLARLFDAQMLRQCGFYSHDQSQQAKVLADHLHLRHRQKTGQIAHCRQALADAEKTTTLEAHLVQPKRELELLERQADSLELARVHFANLSGVRFGGRHTFG